MACLYPLEAWRAVGGLNRETGKWSLTFNPREAVNRNDSLKVPCGKCYGCKLDYARSWALRCMHEAKMHDKNCVLTLTYDDDHLPVGRELDKVGFQKWLKILRSRIGPFRYFGCGEYGASGDRPHYHLCVFGYDFPDKVLITRKGSRQYDSQLLRTIWTKGVISVGDLDFNSAAYVARYCLKKIGGVSQHFHSQPEYLMMSNRPGIGAGFAEKYQDDMMALYACVYDGQHYKIPKYYESKLSESDVLELKLERMKYIKDETQLRLYQKSEYLRNNLKQKERNFEHE